MRALPGRASRTSLAHPAALTREGAHDAQRQRILRATGELIAKRGYNDVTVELIVKRARVSFKTFYKHFAGKEECFLELFDTVVELIDREVRDALAAEPEAPWPQQVATTLRTIFEMIAANPIVARACIVEGPTVGPIVIDRYERMKSLSPLLRRGRDFSRQADELPVTLEDTLAGGVLWSAYQCLIMGELDRIETARLPEAIEFVLRPYIGEAEAARWAGWSEDHTSAPVSVAR